MLNFFNFCGTPKLFFRLPLSERCLKKRKLALKLQNYEVRQSPMTVKTIDLLMIVASFCIAGRLNGTSEMWGQHHNLTQPQPQSSQMNKMIVPAGSKIVGFRCNTSVFLPSVCFFLFLIFFRNNRRHRANATTVTTAAISTTAARSNANE